MNDFARSLAGAMDHRQRAGQFAVPREEWVNASAAVLVLVTVIAAGTAVCEDPKNLNI